MKTYLSLAASALFLILAVTTAQASIVYEDLGDGVVPDIEVLGSLQRGYGYFPKTGNDRMKLMYTHDEDSTMVGGLFFPGVIGISKPAGASTYGYISKLGAGVLLGQDTPDWLEDSVTFLYLKNNHEAELPESEWENMAEGEKGYMGFKFAKDGDSLYGWAELSIDSGTGIFTLYGYAFETEAGKGIITGDTGAAPVPVPAAIWLLGSGLIGLAGVGRKNR